MKFARQYSDVAQTWRFHTIAISLLFWTTMVINCLSFHANTYCWLWVLTIICSQFRVRDWERQSIVGACAVSFCVLQVDEIGRCILRSSGPTAGMALVGHADANRHALLNTRKLPVYSTCRLCQQTQTLILFVVVQGQCTMRCAADDSGMEDGVSAP
jgi:hypothetical protein